jgi:hypothetical protein
MRPPPVMVVVVEMVCTWVDVVTTVVMELVAVVKMVLVAVVVTVVETVRETETVDVRVLGGGTLDIV